MGRGSGKVCPPNQHVVIIQAIGDFACRAVRVVDKNDCFANLQELPIAFHVVSPFAPAIMVNRIGRSREGLNRYCHDMSVTASRP
jgi:hypothetical protein